MLDIPPVETESPAERRLLTLAFVVCLTALVAGSSPRAVGAGGDYLAMALNISDVGVPWLTDSDIARVRRDTATVAPLANWDVISSTRQSRFGTRDFVHFWLYPALASPFVRAARAFGVNLVYGFALLNGLLLLAAFWLALPRLGGWLTWLLFAGPIVWWIDKPHVEIFTFALLTIAVLVLSDSPGFALIAAGAAAAHSLPILAAIPFVVAALAIVQPAQLRSVGLWIGAVSGIVLGGLAVFYYEMWHGRPSLLEPMARTLRPSLRQILLVPFDTNLGLLAAFPAFVFVVALALIVLARTPKRLAAPGILAGLFVLPVFLISFAQTASVTENGTPGTSPYALWLVPLAIPLLAEFNAAAPKFWKKMAALVTVPSVLASVFLFHPKHPDNSRKPTWLAQWVWAKYPQWNNPLAEVFIDVLAPRHPTPLPLATQGCTKALLVGQAGQGEEGMWPIPCYPAEIPPVCREAGTLCYANLSRGQYRFVRVADEPRPEFGFDSGRAWRRSAEATVRQVMDELGWQTLRPGETLKEPALARAVGMNTARSLEAPDRLLVIATATRENARIELRPLLKLTGTFIDPENNEAIANVSFHGAAGARWTVNVPPHRDVVLLVLRGQ